MLVLAALPTRSALWLGIASVLAIALAWAALRMMWTEVLQSRRENAADRRRRGQAYRTLFSARAVEHAEFTTAMTERLAEAHLSRRELEGRCQRRGRGAARRESHGRTVALEQELAVRDTEDADSLAGGRPPPARAARLVKEA